MKVQKDGAYYKIHALDISQFLIVYGNCSENPFQLILSYITLGKVPHLWKGSV